MRINSVKINANKLIWRGYFGRTNNGFSGFYNMYVYWFGIKYSFKDDQKNKLDYNICYKFICIYICSNLKYYVKIFTKENFNYRVVMLCL